MQTDTTTTDRDDACAEVPAEGKKAYEPPRVDDLGPLAQLTRSGGNDVSDGTLTASGSAT